MSVHCLLKFFFCRKPKVRGSKKPRAKGNDAPTRTAAVPSGNFRDSPSRHSDVQPGEVSADEALAATTASSVAAKERFPDCRICGKAGGASIMFLSCRDNVVCPGCSQLLETCNVCNVSISVQWLSEVLNFTYVLVSLCYYMYGCQSY